MKKEGLRQVELRVRLVEHVEARGVDFFNVACRHDLKASWRSGRTARRMILEQVIAADPKALTKDELAERIGVSPTSGGHFNNLGSPRSLGLIDYPQPGTAAALPVLFLE